MPVYAYVGKTTQIISTPWQQPAGTVEMIEPSPAPNAIAQADGTWLVPPDPDLTLGEVENLVGVFPVSYGYVLEKLGFGDVV
ncbi:hypothetical protein N1030_06150 [Desulfovibrio mangrovi]|uniref:hypothetical protein n=1 Tax=Desulfovibrio mangrovi TaxID=2976983 RepID=UPI002247A773|nr:hypothetical protein [Desulfovibrio mangrovi]UZP68550.1 hypothetical protein N1030_06150 [Desulfovibrio mangrovi]